MAAVSLALGITYIIRGTSDLASPVQSDLTNFFLKSAGYILDGEAWRLYAVRSSVPLSIAANDGPPLVVFLYAPLLALSRIIGIGDYRWQIIVVSLPFAPLVPLLGYTVLQALSRLDRGLHGAPRLLAFIFITLSPLAWLCYSNWYHLELPLMLCLLVPAVLALQSGREILAGVLAGLAALTAITSLFPLFALGVLLLSCRRWGSALRMGGVGGAIFLLGLAPFYILDRANFVYSFVSWRPRQQIAANSIWTFFAYSGDANRLRDVLDAVARRLDMPAIIVLITLVSWLAARRLHVTAGEREAWGVMALAALALPMLTKSVWPYYHLQPFVLLLIWEFGTLRHRETEVWRWPVLSAGFLLVAATLSHYIGLKSLGALDRLALGLVQPGLMALFALAIWYRLVEGRTAAADAMEG